MHSTSSSQLALEVQYANPESSAPSEADLRKWAMAAIGDRRAQAELLIRVVGKTESAALNQQYRGKTGATNVLSFPFAPPPPVESDLLGDLVICAPVVSTQAAAQGKTEQAHWAHMVVHGILHLLGYDHKLSAKAAEMENMEIEILARLGFSDPYQNNETS
ncbi:MAG: rRNA maturation RNase YbeY [Candidatus Polarisedimenticolaceae bacterium]|nr:rRNA maturation RNase YbeY [Candidatus Polarisedimenticolaceae bacterium]